MCLHEKRSRLIQSASIFFFFFSFRYKRYTAGYQTSDTRRMPLPVFFLPEVFFVHLLAGLHTLREFESYILHNHSFSWTHLPLLKSMSRFYLGKPNDSLIHFDPLYYSLGIYVKKTIRNCCFTCIQP